MWDFTDWNLQAFLKNAVSGMVALFLYDSEKKDYYPGEVNPEDLQFIMALSSMHGETGWWRIESRESGF